jgi:hypothetical protein
VGPLATDPPADSPAAAAGPLASRTLSISSVINDSSLSFSEYHPPISAH